MKGISFFFLSPLYPFLTAIMTLICHRFGWDMTLIAYFAVTGCFVALFMDDTAPVFTVFLFMNVVVSAQNAPTGYGIDREYYVRHLPGIIVCIAISLLVTLFRMGVNLATGRTKLGISFYAVVLFSASLLLNGVGYEEYVKKNLMYAFFLAILLVFGFVFGAGMKGDERSFRCIAYAFVFLGLFMLVELCERYASVEELKFDLVYLRSLGFNYGWGSRNTMGMLFCLTIPTTAYLAAKERCGWLFYALDYVFLCAAVMTFSRQAMIFAPVALLASTVVLLIVSKYRFIDLSILVAFCVAAFVFYKCNEEVLREDFQKIFETIFTGGDRLPIYQLGWENFLTHPWFGVGFFTELPSFSSVESILPQMYHNTVIQILASCGAVGFLPYLFHRVCTVISLAKRPSIERIFLFLVVLVLLLLSLVDTHLFNYFPTLVYAAMIGILAKTEKQ